jgi:hypothetical protein
MYFGYRTAASSGGKRAALHAAAGLHGGTPVIAGVGVSALGGYPADMSGSPLRIRSVGIQAASLGANVRNAP